MKYSVVIILNRPRPEILATVQHLSDMLAAHAREHEFVLVVNGIGTNYLDNLSFEKIKGVNIKLVQFSRHVTTGTALSGALAHCDGKAIMSCEPYLQLPDEEMVSLLDVFEQGADLVIPWRQDRVDPGINQLQSRLFNRLVQWTTGVGFNDLSCPFRIFRKDILNDFYLYGDLYRFLPIMAARRGYQVIEEPCRHLYEEGETGLYSPREYIGRMVDFLTFHFDMFSSRKPLRYFGKRALYFLAPGSALMLFLLAGASLGFFQIGNSGWLFFSLVLLLLGSMTWSIGLLGELIVFAVGQHRKEYLVDKVVGKWTQ